MDAINGRSWSIDGRHDSAGGDSRFDSFTDTTIIERKSRDGTGEKHAERKKERKKERKREREKEKKRERERGKNKSGLLQFVAWRPECGYLFH